MKDTYQKLKTHRKLEEDEYVTKYKPQHSSEVMIYDDGPNSMINVVPSWLRERLLSDGVVSYMALSEEELVEKVKPTLSMKRLRVAFWAEYERMFKGYGNHTKYGSTETKLGVYRMCNGICTPSFFMDRIVRNDAYLAYVTRPPMDYAMAMEEALHFGVEKLREILNMPLYDPQFNKDGVPIIDPLTKSHYFKANEKVGNLILKTVAMLDMRMRGAIPQRVHQTVDKRSVNYQVRDGNSSVTVDAEKLDNKILSIDDLDDKIKQMTQETAELLNNPSLDLKERRELTSKEETKILHHMKEIAEDE